MSILKQLSKKREGQKGFTLIELLIVVAILGILAAVIIPNVSTFMNTGRLNAARTEAENIKTAALAYYADHSADPTPVNGGWPSNEGDLAPYLNRAPVGSYGFNSSGNITAGGKYPATAATPLFTWSTSQDTWIK